MGEEARLIEDMRLPFADDRPSVLGLIREAAGKRIATSDRLEVQLPEAGDEEDGQPRLRFVAGGLDALFASPDRSPKQTTARSIVATIGRLLRHPSAGAFDALYSQLRRIQTSSIVDETLDRVSADLGDRREALAALARRLVCEAPDVEPVKMGVALLGVSGTAGDEAVVLEIGQAEEFTLYATVALRNLLAEPEDALWRLAKSVHGWGRIATVERLAGTEDPRIRAWLLRDGFRNDIMNEYLAYLAATRGEMLDALSAPRIDEELLLAVADILLALVAGGPAESIEDYRDAAPACVAFLRHALERDAPALNVVFAVSALRELIEGSRAERLRTLPGWSSQAFLDIRTATGSVLQKPGARSAVEAGLASDEPWGDHFVAAQLAPEFGIDPWPRHLDRQRRRIGRNWWHLMQTTDAARVDEVLALAREQLDLGRVGSGPTRSLGLGQDYEDDSAVDFIVQDLRRFPGHGADFIAVGLRGRSVRLRNLTIKALSDWGRESWPPGTEARLRIAIEQEPVDDVRERLGSLLAGRPIE